MIFLPALIRNAASIYWYIDWLLLCVSCQPRVLNVKQCVANIYIHVSHRYMYKGSLHSFPYVISKDKDLKQFQIWKRFSLDACIMRDINMLHHSVYTYIFRFGVIEQIKVHIGMLNSVTALQSQRRRPKWNYKHAGNVSCIEMLCF